MDDVSTVELLTSVSRTLRDSPFRWERYVTHQRRLLGALIPMDRHAVGDLSFAIVEYPAVPARPGEKVYRFALHHAA